MTCTDFCLVRHGETVGNRQGILQGWYDSPLNENGIRQAQAVAAYLQDRHFGAAYSSDSKRAMQTLVRVAERHSGLSVTAVPELREWHLGELEGRPQKELFKEYSTIISAFRHETGNIQAPGGENRMEFQTRVETFLLAVARKHPGKTILIGTHGGTLQRIFRMATGVLDDGNIIPLPANASVSTVRFYNVSGEWELCSWNICEHLRGLDTCQTLLY